MKETNILSQVKEFHQLFELPIIQTPTIPSKDRCDLRVRLIQEELDELKEAIDKNDIIGIADALTDINYVLHGAVLEFGLGEKFKELNDEVHRSNMSKTCFTLDEAVKTQEYYLKKDGTDSYIKKIDYDRLVVCRIPDEKVLKSINYSKANLENILK